MGLSLGCPPLLPFLLAMAMMGSPSVSVFLALNARLATKERRATGRDFSLTTSANFLWWSWFFFLVWLWWSWLGVHEQPRTLVTNHWLLPFHPISVESRQSYSELIPRKVATSFSMTPRYSLRNLAGVWFSCAIRRKWSTSSLKAHVGHFSFLAEKSANTCIIANYTRRLRDVH